MICALFPPNASATMPSSAVAISQSPNDFQTPLPNANTVDHIQDPNSTTHTKTDLGNVSNVPVWQGC